MIFARFRVPNLDELSSTRDKAGVRTMLIVKTLMLTLLILIIYTTVPAEAGMVYGHIYGEMKSVNPEITIEDSKGNEVKDVKVTIDKYKNYSVFILPGVYKITFKDQNNTWEAVIQSYPQTIRQDMYLKKVR